MKQNERKNKLKPHEKAALKKIGRAIKQMGHNPQYIHDLSGAARSTIREVLDGQSNVGIITLDRIAKAAGYGGIVHLLDRSVVSL